jgi:hypothetical protein
VYRRAEGGIIMDNCMLALKHNTVDLFVGLYAQRPGAFSPLGEEGTAPNYTPLENGETPIWSP